MLTPKKQLKLKIINNVESEILIGEYLIRDLLSYENVYWKPGKYKKQRIVYQKTIIKNKRYIYNGFIPMVEKFCKENKIKFILDGELEKLEVAKSPQIKGITFREYQSRFIKIAVKKQRGIFKAATGAGKTILALGIISCFKNCKTLFLAPTKDLMNQTAKTFSSFGYNTTKLGDGNILDLSGDIICSTIQSAKNLDFDEIGNLIDILIVDEMHLAIKNDATLEKIMSNIMAPVRLGFSATPPKDQERKLISTGLFGEILGDLGLEEAKKEGIVCDAKAFIIDIPTIKNLNSLIKQEKEIDKENNKIILQKIKSVSNKKEIEELKNGLVNKTRYQYVYNIALVKNKVRNKIIVNEAIKLINQGFSCIIFVVILKHIEILSNMLNELSIPHECVYGNIKTGERDKIKEGLFNKDINLLISSVVFKTGLDIASLDSIINAGGGKADDTLEQIAGRALRIHESKDHATLIDFNDKGVDYLSKHSEARLVVYKKYGWIK